MDDNKKKIIKVYKSYYNTSPKRVKTSGVTLGPGMCPLGNLETVIYNTDRRGRKERFYHNFKKKKFYTDGKNIIVPGVKVTDRGIED